MSDEYVVLREENEEVVVATAFESPNVEILNSYQNITEGAEEFILRTDASPISLVADDFPVFVGEVKETVEVTEVRVTYVYGGNGDSTLINRTAGQDLSGHRLVVPQFDGTVVYADSADIIDISLPIWMTTMAAMDGDEVELLTFGLFGESSWAWTADLPIYLSTNGLLTQTTPVAPAFLIQVALAVSATELFYNPKIPIVLT